MIDSREHLIHVLTEAAEIEHNLLCSYLYAVFSLKREGEGGLTETQAEAVTRWRKTILSVALEEMAHLACVNNLLLAVGGPCHFDRPNLPVPPGYHPAAIVVRLTPFDAATLDHFIFLERPRCEPMPDGGGFEHGEETRRTPPAITPSAIDYKTIGDLYEAIGDGFTRLAARLGEAVLIDPEAKGQLGPDEARLGDVSRVTNLEQALAVIDLIKEQGEGSSGDREDSHFDRFQAIKAEWAALAQADEDFAPAWPAACDPVMREPAEDAERVWITDPAAAACLDAGNAAYGAMLAMLCQAFGSVDQNYQTVLMGAAIEMMEVAAAAGNRLARMSAREGQPGINAGLTFAVPRSLGFRPSYARAHPIERVKELQAQIVGLFNGEAGEKVGRRLDNALAALES